MSYESMAIKFYRKDVPPEVWDYLSSGECKTIKLPRNIEMNTRNKKDRAVDLIAKGFDQYEKECPAENLPETTPKQPASSHDIFDI